MQQLRFALYIFGSHPIRQGGFFAVIPRKGETHLPIRKMGVERAEGPFAGKSRWDEIPSGYLIFSRYSS